ncbi:hypothetical protein AC578_2732 [Pseudocercospora eumusae]|uniref:Involucrin repeat protein n=1 Tax=Pseudocercospora eumusae TaxID=321146 RepID=A0A139HH64_9PEZI|nr:hypothetical protein AC578_2732 [Pseudocercospora eumusae]
MWKAAFTGRSERGGSRSEAGRSEAGSVSGERRKKSSRSTRGDNESVISSATRRDDDRDRKRSSRYESGSTAGGSVYATPPTSMYGTAPSSRVGDGYSHARPLTESALRMLPNDDDDEWEDEEERKSKKSSSRKKRGSSDEREKRRKSSGKEKERKRSSSRERREKKRSSTSDKEKSRRSEAEVEAELVSEGRQYAGGVMGGTGEHVMSGALPAPAPNTQFPGQDPSAYGEPMQQPGLDRAESFGHAAEYYLDQGESVHFQPGVRANTPNMLVNPDLHLVAASAEAHPVPDTGNGAAADFYAGKVSPVFSTPQPVKPSRPSKQSASAPSSASKPKPMPKPSRTSSTGKVAAAGVSALGKMSSSHQHSQSEQQTSSTFRPQSTYSDYPPTIKPSSNRPSRHNSDGSTYYPAPTQSTNPYGSTSQAGTNGIYATSTNVNANASYSQTGATSAYGGPQADFHPTGTYTGKQSTNSNVPLYAAAGAGAAAAGYAAYQHQHNSNTANFASGDFGQGPPRSPKPPGFAGGGYYGPPGGSGGMMQQHHFHEHKGPMTRLKDGILNLIASPEDTAKMEMYTEYIGVCKHCFDPRTSAWDAPRVHHYHKRKDSFESLRRRLSYDRLGRKRSSERIDKDNRYYASESSKRRRDERASGIGMMGAGLAAAGAATAAGALFNDRKNFDDTYSVKSGHRESSAVRRRSRSSSREQRRRSTHGTLRPDSDYVTVRKKDGTVEKRRIVRSRSRSRSATRKSSGGFGLGTAAAAGAALGAAGLAAHSGRRSRSSSRDRRRRSSGYSPTRYDRPGSPKDQGGIFGNFFSPPSRQRRGSHEKKKRGFFTFSNGSSSSSNSELAFGDTYLSRQGSKASLGRKSSTRSSTGRARRRKSDDHLAATVAGIGATAAALAAAQKGHRISKRGSRPELGAKRHVRTHVTGHQHGSPGSSDQDWEDEPPSDVDQSSLDGGLAFGDYGDRRLSSRQSLESAASSNDGGLGAWGWRWGGKDKKGRKVRRSSSPQSWQPTGSHGSLSGPIAAGLAAGAAGAAFDTSKPIRPQQSLYIDDTGRPLPTADTRSSTSGSSQPLQYVDPQPINSEAGSPRHSMPGAFDVEPPIYRPAQAPIAQPQPMTLTKPAFTQPGADLGYTATASHEHVRPGMSRRTQSSPVQSTWMKDAAAIGGGALAAGAIIAGASALNGSTASGASGRRSKDPNSRVSFGLTSEQQRKEDRERRKEEQRAADDERRRSDRARAVKEEAERAARESRQEEIRQQREDENRQLAEAKLAKFREEEAERARQEVERQRQIAEEKARQDRERQWEIERLEKEARDRAAAAEVARQEAEKQRKAREEAERAQAELERQRREREDNYAREQARLADEARRQDEERKQWEAERYAREWQNASRQGYEPAQKRSGTSSWAAPLAGAAAAATVGAVMAGREHETRRDSSESPRSRRSRRSRRSETEDELERAAKEKYGERSSIELRDGYAAAEIKPMNEHSGEPLMDDDIYDPDYFKRKQQGVRREELARKAAEKVVASRERSTSPYFEHDTYADFFRPAGLGSKGGYNESNPHPDADVAVYHAQHDDAHYYFPQDQAWPKGPHFDEFVSKGTRARSKSAPFGVPRLNVMAPTPPPEEQEKRRRRPGPLPPSSLSREADADEEGSTSTKSSGKSERSRSISWGEDKYHTYDVQTPDSHHERESYITSPDLRNAARDAAKVAGVAGTAAVAGKALHEVIVEEPSGRKSRDYTYNDNDFGKDTYSTEKPADEEEGVEEIQRTPEAESKFSRAGLGGAGFYQQPFYESVSDVGSRFQMPSPGTTGALPSRGFVEEMEIDDDTPAEEKKMPGTWAEEEADIYRPAPKSKEETDTVPGAERDVPTVSEEPAWEPPLSKKEKKKREKAARKSGDFDSFYSGIPTPPELERVQTLDEEVVGSPGGMEGEYFPPPTSSKKDKKKKKKSGAGLSFADLVSEVFAEPESPAELERVQTLEDSATSTPKDEAADDYFPALSKKEKKKREREAKKQGFGDIVVEASGPKDGKSTFDDIEQSRDSKGKKSGSSFADLADGILAAGGVAAAATALNGSNDSASESPSGSSSKKDKKKKRKSKLGESTFDDPRDYNPEVETVDTTKPPLSSTTEKEPTGMPGGWDESESPPRKTSIDEQSQSQVKEEQTPTGVQEPSTSQEADPWEWSAPTSKKSKKKSKRASLANQPEISSPLRSEVAWDDYTSAKVTAEPESYSNDYGFPVSNQDAKSDASRSEPVTVIDTSKPPLSQAWDEPKPQANISAYRSSDDKPQDREATVSRSSEEKRESRSGKASADIERKLSGSQKSTSPDDARSVASESAAERRKSRREEARSGSDYASGYDRPDYAYETQSVAASESAYPGEDEKRRKRRSKHEDDDDDTRSVTSSRSRRDKDERRRSKYDDDDTASVISSRSRRDKEESSSVKKEKKGLFGGLFGRNKSFDGTSSSSKDKDRDGAPLSRSSTRDSKDRDGDDDDRRRRKKKHRDSEYGDDDDDTRSVKSESHRRHRSAGDRGDDKDSRERTRRSTHDDRDDSRSAISESGHRHHRRRRTDDDGESLSRTDSRGAVSESGHRHHSRRSTGDELGRDSRDQSFLGNRVEGLPPLPASHPASPDSAVERREGRPLEAESGRGSMVKDAMLVGGAVVGASLLAEALSSKASDDKDHADDITRSAEDDQRYDEAHKSAVEGIIEPETPAKPREAELGDANLSAERPASLQRPVSSTAVPLRFPFGHAPTTPGSADRPSAKERAKSFSSPSTAGPQPAGTPTTPSSAKSRQGRPHSSEFKGVMPLYLVERNRQTPEVEEGLPSLPSSKPSSRASSVHGSDDGFQSAVEEWDSPSASHRNLPALDLAGIGAPSYQSEDETTPKASHFPQTAIPWAAASTTPTAEKREKQQPQFFTWEDYVQDEKMHEQQEASREEPSSTEERSRSRSPSKAKALAAAAMLGTAAVYGKHKLESQYSEQAHDLGPVGPKYEYPLPAPLTEPTPAEPADKPESSREGSKKNGKKSKKQIQDTETPTEGPHLEAERQDTEDFFDAESHAEEGNVSRERGQPAATAIETANPQNALDRFLSNEQHAEEGDGHFFASVAAHTVPVITVQEASPDAERRVERDPQDCGYIASAAAHTMPVLPRLEPEEGTEQFFEGERAEDEGAIKDNEPAVPPLQRDEPVDAEDERPATAYKIPEAKSEPASLVVDERTIVAAPEATVEVAPAPQLTRKQSKKAKKKQRASTIFEDEPQTALESSPAEASGAQTPVNETEAPREVNFGLSDFSQITHDNTWGDSQAQAFQTSMSNSASKPRLGSVHDADGLSLHDVQVDNVHSPVEGRAAPATSVPAPWATQQAGPETDDLATSSSSSKKKGKKDKKKKPAPSWSEEPSEAEPAESSSAGLAIGALAGVAAAAAVDDWTSPSSSKKKAKKDKKKKPPTWSEPEGIDAAESEPRDETLVQEQDNIADDAKAADEARQAEPVDVPHEPEEPVAASGIGEAVAENSREALPPAGELEAPAAEDFLPIVSKKKAKKGKKDKSTWDEEKSVEETDQQHAEHDSNANTQASPESQDPESTAEEPRELVKELPDVQTPVAEVVQPDESAAQSALGESAPVSSKKKSKKDKKKAEAAAWDEFNPVSETAEPDTKISEEVVAETAKDADPEQDQNAETLQPDDSVPQPALEEFAPVSSKKSKKDKKKAKDAAWDEFEPASGTFEPKSETREGIVAETANDADQAVPEASGTEATAPQTATDAIDEVQVAEKPTLSGKQTKKDKNKKKSAFARKSTALELDKQEESGAAVESTEQASADAHDELVIPAEDLGNVLDQRVPDFDHEKAKTADDGELVIPPESLNTVLQPTSASDAVDVNQAAEQPVPEENANDDFKPTLSRKQSKKDKKKKKASAWEPGPEPQSEPSPLENEARQIAKPDEEAQAADDDIVIPSEALNTPLPPDTSDSPSHDGSKAENENVDDDFKPTLSRKQSKKDEKKKKKKSVAWGPDPEADSQTEKATPIEAATSVQESEQPSMSKEDEVTIPEEALNTVLQPSTDPAATVANDDATTDAIEEKSALTRKQSKKNKKKNKSSAFVWETQNERDVRNESSPEEGEPARDKDDLVVPPEAFNTILQTDDSPEVDTADDANKTSLSRKQSKKDKKKKKQQSLWEPEPDVEETTVAAQSSSELVKQAKEVPLPAESPDESFQDDSFHDAEEFNDTQATDTFHEAAEISITGEQDVEAEPVKQSWADEMEAEDPSAIRPSHERHDSNLVDDVFGIADGSGELHATLSNDQNLVEHETSTADRGLEFEPERATEDMDAFGEASPRASADWTGFSKKKGKKGKKSAKKSEPATPVAVPSTPVEESEKSKPESQDNDATINEAIESTLADEPASTPAAEEDFSWAQPSKKKGKKGKKSGTQTPVVKESVAAEPASETVLEKESDPVLMTLDDQQTSTIEQTGQIEQPEQTQEPVLETLSTEPLPGAEVEHPQDDFKADANDAVPDQNIPSADDPAEFSWSSSSKKGKEGKKGKKDQLSQPELPATDEGALPEPASEQQMSIDESEIVHEQPIEDTQHTAEELIASTELALSEQQVPASAEEADEFTWSAPTKKGKKGKKGKKSGTQTPQAAEEPVLMVEPDHDMPAEEQNASSKMSETKTADIAETSAPVDEALSTDPNGEIPQSGPESGAPAVSETTFKVDRNAQDAEPEEESAWTSSKKKGKKGKKSRQQSVADVPSTEDTKPSDTEAALEPSRDLVTEDTSPGFIEDATPGPADEDQAKPATVQNEPEDEVSWAPSSKKKKKSKKGKKAQDFEPDAPVEESPVPVETATPSVEEQASEFVEEPIKQGDDDVKPSEDTAAAEAEDILALPSSKEGKKSGFDTPEELKPEVREADMSDTPIESATPLHEQRASETVEEPIKQLDDGDKPSEEPAAAEAEDIWAMTSSKKNKKGKKGRDPSFDAPLELQPDPGTPIETTTPDTSEPVTLGADEFSGFTTSKKKKGKKGKKSATGTATPLSEAIEADQTDVKIDMAEAEVQAPEDQRMEVEDTAQNVEANSENVTDDKPVEQSLEEDTSVVPGQASNRTETAEEPFEHDDHQHSLIQREVATEQDCDSAAMPDTFAEASQAENGADSRWEPTSSKKQKKKAKKNKQAFDFAAEEAEKTQTPALPTTIDTEKTEPAPTPIVDEDPETHASAEAERQSLEVDDWSTSASGKKRGNKGKKSKQLAFDHLPTPTEDEPRLEEAPREDNELPSEATTAQDRTVGDPAAADDAIADVAENVTGQTPTEETDEWSAPQTGKKKSKKEKKKRSSTLDDFPAADAEHDSKPEETSAETAEVPKSLSPESETQKEPAVEDFWSMPSSGKKSKKGKKNRQLALDEPAEESTPVEEKANDPVAGADVENDVQISEKGKEDALASTEQEELIKEPMDLDHSAAAAGQPDEPIVDAETPSAVPEETAEDLAFTTKKSKKDKKKSKKGAASMSDSWNESAEASEGPREAEISNDTAGLGAAAVAGAIAAAALAEPQTSVEEDERAGFSAKRSKKDKKKAKKSGASTPAVLPEESTVVDDEKVMPSDDVEDNLNSADSTGQQAQTGAAEQPKDFDMDLKPSSESVEPQPPAEEDEWDGFSMKRSKKDKKKAKKSGASTPAIVSEEQAVVENRSTSADSGERQDSVDAAEQSKAVDLDPALPSETVERTRSSPVQDATQDIDFAATLAAGLADSGFDPNMVINDPVFHRRASPTGQAEADPEEVFSTTTSKRKKNKKGSESRDLSREVSPAIGSFNVEDKPPADDVTNIIQQSLGGAGFDPELIEKAMASNNTSSADIDNDQPEISFATSKRKKGKKAKKESASGTEWWQVSTPQEGQPDVQAAQTSEKGLQTPADPTTDDQQSQHGWLVQDELDIDAGDKAYREYKKKKRQQRKLKAAAQAAGLSDNPESAMDDTERSTVVSDSETGVSRATTKDQRPPQPLSPVLEKAAPITSAKSEPAAVTTSPTSAKSSIVSSVFPGLERVKRRAPSIPAEEGPSQQTRKSSSGSQSRALLHTSEVSQHLPVQVPRTPPQGHEPRSSDSDPKEHASDLYKAAAGVAAISAGAAIASALDKEDPGAKETSRSMPADEPSWSFAALQDGKQHQPIRDSGYQEGKRASQQNERSSREMPEVHTSTSFDSLRQRRSLEPLHISTPSSPEKEWKLQTPKQRSGPSDKNLLEAHARTPSADTPLLPTSKNRTSYLFQSPPDILAEAADSSPQLPEARSPTYTSDHGAHSRARASSRGSEPSPVSGTDGAMDRSAFSPTSPRAPLDSIPEESHHARKRSKARNEVGGPEHIKAIKRTETPQNIREKEQALSPNIRPSVSIPSGGSARSASNPLSTSDDVYNRLSWPAVDEEHETVNLDRRHASQARSMPDPRSPSVMSNRSNVSAGHFKSPQELRSYSRNSNQSNRSSTPSLRRTSLSGDLRAASRRGLELSDAGSAVGARSSPKTIPFEPPPTPPLNDDDIEGSASRAVDMNDDVFQGYGDAQQQSQVSPTRPPSVRKRQSMHINELESRLDQLVAENRALQEAKEAGALQHGANGQSLQEMLNARDLQLQAKDAEINQIKAMLQPMQEELQRLTEMNNGLTEANRNLVDDTNGRYATLQAEHSQAHEQWQSTAKELEHMRSEHGRITSGMRDIVEAEIANALADKNAEILRLREQLDIAAEQIRALQVQIQGSKSSDFLIQRDEDYFDGACQKLCQHVQQWVLRFSKMSDNRVCRLSTELNDDKMEARLDNAILDGSDVDKLLGDRVRRRDVFMSVVMTMVWEYVFTRYLFGMDREQRQKLKALEKLLSEVGPPRAVAHWRATTLTLLAKRPQFHDQCSLDTEAVANEIFEVLCRLLPPPSASRSQLLSSLQKVLRVAVDLSIEMRTQRAEYIMLPPLQPEYDTNGDLVRKVYFNASLMNERSGFFSSNEELAAEHAVVKVVLFPLVVKKGDDVGEGEEEIVVCPAQVLVQNDNGKGKKVVRVMSGAMEIDDPIRSTRSRQSNRSLVSEAPGSAGF